LDQRPRLPESKFSYRLQDWDQSLVVESPYAEVNSTLTRILGLSQSVRSLERSNRQLAAAVPAFWAAQPVPSAAAEREVVVGSCDGKGVLIRGAAVTPAMAEPPLKCGPKPGRNRMALVGTL